MTAACVIVRSQGLPCDINVHGLRSGTCCLKQLVSQQLQTLAARSHRNCVVVARQGQPPGKQVSSPPTGRLKPCHPTTQPCAAFARMCPHPHSSLHPQMGHCTITKGLPLPSPLPQMGQRTITKVLHFTLPQNKCSRAPALLPNALLAHPHPFILCNILQSPSKLL